MDEFDAVDIVYNAVAAAGTDVMIFTRTNRKLA